ncbi:hypothetical protein S83_039068, partial [Arachis hypogaea]
MIILQKMMLVIYYARYVVRVTVHQSILFEPVKLSAYDEAKAPTKRPLVRKQPLK